MSDYKQSRQTEEETRALEAEASEFEYIRKTYSVPAKKGGRVLYLGRWEGTITGARDGRVLIRLDDSTPSCPYHPTWELEYLEDVNARATTET